MYTRESINITPVPNSTQMKMKAVLSNGTDKVTIETVVSTISDIKSAIIANLKRLNERDEAIKQVAEGTLTIEPEAVPEKTRAELAQEEWVKDWGNLKKVQPLIDSQVLTGKEKPLIDLRAKVKNNFKTDYLNLI